MRIAHLILTRRLAGSERHAVELANAQAERHDVTLILRRAAAGSHAGAFAALVSPRVKLVLVPDWLPAWHAARVLRRLKPDVAHAHLSAACRALRGLSKTCLRVATLHIHYKTRQHAHLDALVAIAPWQLADIPEPLRRHTVQIDNWTLARTPSPDARERLRLAHGIPSDAWVFGALGRIEPSKGFDMLIDAFADAGLPDDAWLVVVGPGAALPALQRQATARATRVLLPGYTRTPQDWLAAFDCFVSAARSEPFGLVFLEAMQAGLPVIASRTQGALHLSPHMQPTLVDVDDLPALRAALQAAARQRPERRSYPMDHYRIDGKLHALEAFYLRELALRGGAPGAAGK